jgi:hypothetical protein
MLESCQYLSSPCHTNQIDDFSDPSFILKTLFFRHRRCSKNKLECLSHVLFNICEARAFPSNSNDKHLALFENIRQARDTQHNDSQHKDPQHNASHHNDTQHNNIQYNDIQFKDTKHEGLIYDTQHNNALPLL